MAHKKDEQKHINVMLIILIAVLAVYSGFLTYEIAANRSASESVDRSLAEELFKLNVEQSTQAQK